MISIVIYKYMKVTVKAHAKVNISLKVVGKRKDGYHLLDSIVSEIGLCDYITVETRDDKAVVVDTSIGKIEGDTTYKMAKYLVETLDVNGVNIYVEKHIPFGAGLGGSSADAAGVYRAMRQLYGFDDISDGQLATIGADVPFMVKGGSARMMGIGERVQPISMPRLYMAIVIASGKMTTAGVYKNIDDVILPNLHIDNVLKELQNRIEGDYLFNDLEEGAIDIDICKAKSLLKEAGYTMISMTGSGNAVVGYSFLDTPDRIERLKANLNDLQLIVDKTKG